MKHYPGLAVCAYCDSVYRRRALAPGEVARCGRCMAVLYRAGRANVDGWLALTLAAAMVFGMANLYPVIRINLQGRHNEATLWQSAAALAAGPVAPVAVPTAMAVMVVPLMQIALLTWVLAFARSGRRAPGFAHAIRWLAALRPWSMVEVGLLGILVTMVKLSGLMQVQAGPGMWAVAGLVPLLTLLASCDLHALWALTEHRPWRRAARK